MYYLIYKIGYNLTKKNKESCMSFSVTNKTNKNQESYFQSFSKAAVQTRDNKAQQIARNVLNEFKKLFLEKGSEIISFSQEALTAPNLNKIDKAKYLLLSAFTYNTLKQPKEASDAANNGLSLSYEVIKEGGSVETNLIGALLSQFAKALTKLGNHKTALDAIKQASSLLGLPPTTLCTLADAEQKAINALNKREAAEGLLALENAIPPLVSSFQGISLEDGQ